MYDDIHIHVARSYTSSADRPFTLISSFTCPSISSSAFHFLSCFSHMYFHFHSPPSYVVHLSSHHMSILLRPPFLDFLCDFPHLRRPSYYFISIIVQLPNSAHSSYYSHFCDLQFLSLCLFQCPCLCPAHQCREIITSQCVSDFV